MQKLHIFEILTILEILIQKSQVIRNIIFTFCYEMTLHLIII